MRIMLNGEAAELASAATLAEAISAAGADPDGRGVAAAVEGEVVARGLWRARELREGENVEVVHAVQGG
jgi:sulfur carrier protein